jgi:hypothetical protein
VADPEDEARGGVNRTPERAAYVGDARDVADTVYVFRVFREAAAFEIGARREMNEQIGREGGEGAFESCFVEDVDSVPNAAMCRVARLALSSDKTATPRSR